jgi:(4-alkanoyl-5-oxo-2,5-dihydrofuran-3-yl)methyl phosphate reductase
MNVRERLSNFRGEDYGIMIYLITGATGNVGSLVTERLIARGVRPRIFVRDAAKAQMRYGENADIHAGDLGDAASLSRALADVEVLFLVNSGHELAMLDALAADAAKEAGVKRLVKLSSYDAREQSVGTGVWHAAGEAAIRKSGVPFVFVQPSGFMSNALYWAKSIKIEGLLRSATGEGRIPFIHPVDIADIAVEAMTQPECAGQSLPITGPEALTYAQMGGIIGAAIGKDVRFVDMSEEEARAQQIAWKTPPALVEARLSIFRAIREGRLAKVTDTVETVLGRKPIAFGEWATENANVFR